jgi:hypothetical protein
MTFWKVATFDLTPTERQFQAQVLRYAALRGWHVWRDRATNQRTTCAGCRAPLRCAACGERPRPVRNDAGHPDLILVRRPRWIWVELKGPRTPTTPEQKAWLAELRACGQEAYLWRPDDWPTIEKVLS